MSRSEIYTSGNVLDKNRFFKLYIKTYNWSKALFTDKKYSKRLRDGIQRYFKSEFRKTAAQAASQGQPYEKIIDDITKQARVVMEMKELVPLLGQI